MTTNEIEEIRRKIRFLVNDLFQDVDTEKRFTDETANAICEVHTKKILNIFIEYGEECRYEGKVEGWDECYRSRG